MGMGQEDEATNETIDQIRREHHSIKTWYNNNIDNINVSYLRSKYGNYPTFWQDVMKWDGYKETWKLYWKDIELQKNKNNDSSNNGDGNGSSSTNNNRKRKSRWSSRNDDTTTTTATSTTANNNVSTDSNTKSEQQKQQQQPTTAVQCEKKKPRRSRWSSTNPNKPSSTTSLKPTAETGILGLLPGIPKGMTQYEKLFALWGVTTQQDNKGAATSSNKNTNLNNNDKQPTLPNTIESLTNELCDVITNTLCNKQYYDPKIITNIRSKNILINYRPYVKKNINYNTNNNDDIDHDRDHEIDNNDDHDNDIDIDNDKKEADDTSSGTTLQEQQLRIGIELDGLRYLNTNYYRHHNNNINNNNNNNRKKIKREEELEIISLIKLSLLLSSKLSQCQWKHIEEEVQNDKKRTIMLHFTTLSETIIASKQLLYLRQLEKQQEYYNSVQNMNSNTTYSSIYDCFGIRGRGSVKEGARGRRDGKAMDGDDEPLHVVITGDEQSNVDRAGQLINDMLVVIDDEKNVHKQQQLRELALLNGTLKDEEFCHLCAEKGHRSFECPKRFNTMNNTKKVQVKCAICGDTSHPTRDCAMKTNVVDQNKVDHDYLSFMAELDGKPAPDICLPATAITPSVPTNTTATNTATEPNLESKFAAIPPPPGLNSAADATTGTNTAPTQTAALNTSMPPPVVVPPTPQQTQQQNAAYAAAYQQQQQYAAYTAAYQQQVYAQQQATAVANPYYQQQQQYAYMQQPQQQYANNNNADNLTEGWDYTSFYGPGTSGTDNTGAGGFEWWDNQDPS